MLNSMFLCKKKYKKLVLLITGLYDNLISFKRKRFLVVLVY